MTTIDVCMPTFESAAVIDETLEQLATAAADTDIDIDRLVVIDNMSDDGTHACLQRAADDHDWTLAFERKPLSLPAARERAIDAVSTDWFLFLDDDVRLSPSYFEPVTEWTGCARVGAIQGRKQSRQNHPADWIRRRVRRGGTHATLLRTDAVRGVSIPADVAVLEDEFLRRCVESNGYRWVLEPEAVFEHDCQDRHPIGWTEGYVGGKYGLSQPQTVGLNVPFAAATGRNPLPHAKRLAGWVAGRLSRRNAKKESS
jgi:glycosyltransferase involved in cell wall biosynthesis